MLKLVSICLELVQCGLKRYNRNVWGFFAFLVQVFKIVDLIFTFYIVNLTGQ